PNKPCVRSSLHSSAALCSPAPALAQIGRWRTVRCTPTCTCSWSYALGRTLLVVRYAACNHRWDEARTMCVALLCGLRCPGSLSMMRAPLAPPPLPPAPEGAAAVPVLSCSSYILGAPLAQALPETLMDSCAGRLVDSLAIMAGWCKEHFLRSLGA